VMLGGSTTGISRTATINLRSIGVSLPARPVRTSRSHPRNHDGEYFTCLAIARTTADPRPGSDEISRACEEARLRDERLPEAGRDAAETCARLPGPRRHGGREHDR